METVSDRDRLSRDLSQFDRLIGAWKLGGMGRNLEIERRFLVRKRPTGWKRKASSEIVQGYFPTSKRELEIRLRRKDSKHFITVKGGRGRRRLEEEIEISQRRFQSLWPLTREARVTKRRYQIPCGENTIEVDVYKGPHRGLVTADVEFNSLHESRAFQPPKWLGREITGKEQYANRTLARRKAVPAH